MNQNEINFCNYLKSINKNFNNKEREMIYYETKLLKDTLTSLRRLKQNTEVKNRIINIKKQMQGYEKMLDQIPDKTPEEILDLLKKDIRINDITIEDKDLFIITNDMIFCGYNIGQYIIKINFEDTIVNIERLDGLNVNGYEHTFINHGKVCFGDASLNVQKALMNGGFFSVVQLCLSLLSAKESTHNGGFITSSDFIRGINRWR